MSTPIPNIPKVPLPSSAAVDPDRNKWAVLPVTNGKARYAAAFPEGWKNGALHHKISKEKLSSIGEQLTPACNSQDPALQLAGRTFWYLCCHLAGSEIYSAVLASGQGAANPKRMLWNLPIMFSLGPENPATDPGMNFDPDTEPVPDRNGIRRMDAVSVLLKQVEDIWDAASDANHGQGVYNAAMWTGMTSCLVRAAALANEQDDREDRLLYRPKYEQWLFDHETKQTIRKGLVVFPQTPAGTAIFRAARNGAPAIAAYKGNATVVFSCQVNSTYNGAPMQFTLNITQDVVHHICVRHTTRFFDFTDATGRPRPINTMWQNINTLADATALAARLMPFIAQICVREMQRSNKDLNDWDGQPFELGMEQAGPDTVYFTAQVQDVDDQAGDVTVDIVTIAPDQASAIGFLREELTAIGHALGY